MTHKPTGDAERNPSLEKITIEWLAVHPTPYNSYLFRELQVDDRWDIAITYSKASVKNLGWNADKKDKISNTVLGVDFGILRRSFDSNRIFICTGWNDKTRLLVMMIRRTLSLPYGFWTDSIKKTERPRGFVTRCLFWIKQWLLNGADFVMTTGNFGVSQMKRSGLMKHNERLFSFPFYVPVPRERKDSTAPVATELSLLIASRLIERKGIEHAIEALAILKKKNVEASLVVAGTGPLEHSLKELSQSLGIGESVKFCGWLNGSQLAQEMLNSTFLVHPVTSVDPFPLIVLESLAIGLPVIGSELAGSVADRVKHGWNGYVVAPNSAIAIADTISNFLSNRSSYECLVENAKRSADEWTGARARDSLHDIISATDLRCGEHAK